MSRPWQGHKLFRIECFLHLKWLSPLHCRIALDIQWQQSHNALSSVPWPLSRVVPKEVIKASAARGAVSWTTGHEKCIIPGCAVSSSSLRNHSKEKNVAVRWMNFLSECGSHKWEAECPVLNLAIQNSFLIIGGTLSLSTIYLPHLIPPHIISPSVKSCSSRSATAATTSATPSWPCRETARLSEARTRIRPVPPPPPTLWWFSNWWWATAGGCRRRCWPSWLQRRAGTGGWVHNFTALFTHCKDSWHSSLFNALMVYAALCQTFWCCDRGRFWCNTFYSF